MKPRFLLTSFLLIIAITKTIAQAPTKIEIYLLKSHSIRETVLSPAIPPITLITDTVLADTPLVRNEDIISYNPKTATLYLRYNFNQTSGWIIPGEAFAVTLNKKPIYYGIFHPRLTAYSILA